MRGDTDHGEKAREIRRISNVRAGSTRLALLLLDNRWRATD
jgi:hypothetical protein